MTTPAFTKPIVCGTDFSPHAQEAADAAATLARRLKVPLLLVHAEAMPLDSPFAQAWLEPVRKSLQEEADRLRAQGTEVEEIFSSGLPDESLVSLAEERGAALLVVSSLGRRLPARWLIGSVAERTAESATVPTLVIRRAEPFQQWALGQKPLNIYVGVDFGHHSDAALRWVAELCALGPCEVTTVYIDWPPKDSAQLGIYGPLGLVGNEPETQHHIENDLRRRVRRVLGEVPVKINVEGSWGSVDAHLVDLATRHQADLIVIGTHQWHGFQRLKHGSVSRAVVRHSPTSVVCVPTAPAPTATPEATPAAPAIRDLNRILVGVDLGERDDQAASYAYSMVKPGGLVRLIYVESHAPATPELLLETEDPAAVASRQREHDRIAALEERLRGLSPVAAEGQGIRTEVEVVDATDAARAISEAADRFNADVVCVGGHTRPGFLAKVMGSVALGVLTHCRRPVLVVRPKEE